MIKTPLSTVIGGAFWTPGATVIGGKKPSSSLEILKLFANGEQGFFYDPNDLSTMFQDAAGTIPVTAAGQSVGLIRDKSGRNNHAYQTTSASRPILRKNAVTGANYLEFDGSDDFLQTSNIDFTATDKMSLFAGVRKLSDAKQGLLCELSSAWAANAGSFALLAPAYSGGPTYSASMRFSLDDTANQQAIALGYSAPTSNVLAVKFSKITDFSINGTTVVTNGADKGAGNFGNYPLYIGRRGGAPTAFNGHIYGLIGVGKLTSDSETKALEKELAKRTGVTLNV